MSVLGTQCIPLKVLESGIGSMTLVTVSGKAPEAEYLVVLDVNGRGNLPYSLLFAS